MIITPRKKYGSFSEGAWGTTLFQKGLPQKQRNDSKQNCGLKYQKQEELKMKIDTKAIAAAGLVAAAYCAALTVGCFIANIFSPMALDMVFGTAATLAAAIPMYLIGRNADKNRLPKMIAASLMPVVSNALIVGMELKVFVHLPFWLSAAEVAVGEVVCVTLLGVFLFTVMEKNSFFKKLIING